LRIYQRKYFYFSRVSNAFNEEYSKLLYNLYLYNKILIYSLVCICETLKALAKQRKRIHICGAGIEK